jgi:hypothetical protein
VTTLILKLRVVNDEQSKQTTNPKIFFRFHSQEEVATATVERKLYCTEAHGESRDSGRLFQSNNGMPFNAMETMLERSNAYSYGFLLMGICDWRRRGCCLLCGCFSFQSSLSLGSRSKDPSIESIPCTRLRAKAESLVAGAGGWCWWLDEAK